MLPTNLLLVHLLRLFFLLHFVTPVLRLLLLLIEQVLLLLHLLLLQQKLLPIVVLLQRHWRVGTAVRGRPLAVR